MSTVQEKSDILLESDQTSTGVGRRHFLEGLVGVSGAALLFGVLDKLVEKPEEMVASLERSVAAHSPTFLEIDPEKSSDVLTRMQAELQRALQKTPAERRWIMVIDLRKCVGCHACTIACVAENKLPPGVVYRPVMEEEMGTYPNVRRRFTPRPCMQCENPPCVPVCPVNATYTNEEGIVVMNYDRCIGCRYCITACPYSARTADFGFMYTQLTPVADGLIVGRHAADDYERAVTFEYGEERSRSDRYVSPKGNARKCHFCQHRILEGMLPACVTTCIGRATYFGDANDADSLVAELAASPNVMRLKEELGTEPRVYYLV
jgi:Fe-S-cluster-containing dehydrogenase component